MPCPNPSGSGDPRGWLAHLLAQTLLTAVAYLLCAQAGKTLALPPGYSSPVWPAAGLALAVLLKWGPRHWPGIWLGAFAFNLGLDVSTTGAAIAALIAAGSTLQALIGARLARHSFAVAKLNTDDWRLFASLLLRGPLVCLVAASVGIATLYGFGLMPRQQWLQQWLAWAAGDILGVLLFAPFFVWAWPGERNAGVLRARRMALPLLVAAAFLTLTHLGVGRWEAQRLNAEHNTAAQTVFEVVALPLPAEPTTFERGLDADTPDAQRTIEFEPAAGNAAYVPGQAAQVLPVVSVAFALLVCFASVGAAGRSEAMARDQQQREQFQAAQQASELYLATMLQSIGDAVIAADAHGVITRINRAAERLTGLRAASAPGLALTAAFAVVDESTREPIALEVGPVTLSGAARELGRRAVLVAGDGSEHPIVGNVAPIVGADGSAQGVVLVIREVAEERAMLAELTDSEARFRALTALSSDWFWEQDAELRFVQIASGVHDVGGIPHEAHVGKTRWELPYTDIVSSTWEAHRAELQARQPFHDLLLCRRMPQGHRYVLVSGAPHYAVDGSFAGYRGVGRDVTQQKQAEIDLIHARDEAQAASRAKSEFLANMSHEIRTPMNGVIGMADVLAGSSLSTDQDDAVQTIRSSALSLLGLIDDLLDFSKIEAGRLELERTAADVGAVVEGVCRSLLELALRGNVLLSVFVDPRLPAAVWSDPTRLRQLLTNLIGNAIKFSGGRPERPGRVAVRVEIAPHDPLRLALSVADNGIGMSAQTIAGLFTSFTQAEASTTRRFGGSGLGLAISRRLVELMQGTIGVQSTLDSGSLFTVELPLEPVANHPQPGLDDLSGVECIVMEMPPLPTGDLCLYLEHAGAQVRRARDVQHALQLTVGRGQPVVVLRHVDGDGRVADPHAAAFASCEQARHVLLRRGRYGRPRSENSSTVTIDADALMRAALLAGVATAAGRRSPKAYRSSVVDTVAVDEPSVPTLAEARTTGRLVLVAEDDLVNQKIILRQLALIGLAAEVASDGGEALELWRGGGHAILLTDLHMPTMDGYTLAQCIRSEERPGARMPILALTANALQGEAARARACGMDDYLTKPIQLHELKAALRPWIAPTGRAATVAPTPDADLAHAPVDLSVLRRLVGDDDAVIHEFLRDFLTAMQKLRPALSAAGDAADVAEVAAIAHKLKSSSRSIGALVLGDLCAELENAGRAGRRDDMRNRLRTLDVELARVEESLLAALPAWTGPGMSTPTIGAQ